MALDSVTVSSSSVKERYKGSFLRYTLEQGMREDEGSTRLIRLPNSLRSGHKEGNHAVLYQLDRLDEESFLTATYPAPLEIETIF